MGGGETPCEEIFLGRRDRVIGSNQGRWIGEIFGFGGIDGVLTWRVDGERKGGKLQIRIINRRLLLRGRGQQWKSTVANLYVARKER